MEPLTRLLVKENGKEKILTDSAEIQNAIIEQNISHFSEAENTPLGLGTFLQKEIGPHGTSDFCDRVLEGSLGQADKEDIAMTETYELLQHMQRKKETGTRTPYQWIKETITDLLAPPID